MLRTAAYHRIVERGEDTERFHNIATRLLVASMVTLPIGISGGICRRAESDPVNVAVDCKQSGSASGFLWTVVWV